MDPIRQARGSLLLKNKWLKVAIALILIIAAIIVLRTLRQNRIEAMRDPFSGYEEAAASISEITRSVEASGNVEAGRKDLLYTQYSVKVTEVLSKSGETVKKGQLIAKYESSGLKEDIKQTASDLEAAKDAASRAMTGGFDLSMLSSMALGGAGTTDPAQLESSYKKLVDAQGRLTYKAPFDGILSKLEGMAGQELSGTTAQSPLIELIGTDLWYVDVDVSEYDINSIKLGMGASVEILAAGETIEGEVTGISLSPARSGNIVSYPVRITLKGAFQTLKPGMSADAAIAVYRKEGALTIPYGFATENEGVDEVVVKGADGRPEVRKVVLGEEGDEGLEVLEGISEGEAVYRLVDEGASTDTPGGLFNFRARMTGR